MTADKKRWYALALICVAQFMVVLDVSIVNVALPTIAKDLEFEDASGLQWVVSAYALMAGGFLLLGGRLADVLGRRLIFMVGLVVFSAGSLLCGLAQSDQQLIFFRGFQGLGAALVAPAALSLITALFEEGPDRNKALGVMGAMSGSGAAFGVLLGGVITEYLSWNWIFFVNVPVGVAALILAPMIIPESHAELGHRRFDFTGAVVVTASLVLLVYGIVNAASAGWGSTQTLGLLAISLGGLAVFVLIESRSRAPLMPLRIWSNRNVTGANIVGFMIGASIFAMFFILALYMQDVLGYKPVRAGVSYLAVALTVVVSAAVAGKLVTIYSVRTILAVGLAIAAVGLYYFTWVSPGGDYWHDLFPGFIISGIGLGFSFVPVTIAALAGVSNQDAGLASGLINTSQQIGGGLGTAIVTSVAASRFADLVPDAKHATAEALAVGYTSSYTRAFWVLLAFCIVGLIATLVVMRPIPAVAAETVPEPA